MLKFTFIYFHTTFLKLVASKGDDLFNVQDSIEKRSFAKSKY